MPRSPVDELWCRDGVGCVVRLAWFRSSRAVGTVVGHRVTKHRITRFDTACAERSFFRQHLLKDWSEVSQFELQLLLLRSGPAWLMFPLQTVIKSIGLIASVAFDASHQTSNLVPTACVHGRLEQGQCGGQVGRTSWDPEAGWDRDEAQVGRGIPGQVQRRLHGVRSYRDLGIPVALLGLGA
jgi:hypothetical protein